jgi:hypothetical protein
MAATSIEIIDLTMDEEITIRPKPRVLPKCGYCGVYGHQVRKCNNEYIINESNKIYRLVAGINIEIRQIIDVFLSYNGKDLKFLSMELLNIPFHKQVTQEEFVSKIHNFVKETRDLQLSNMLYRFTNYLSIYDELTDGLARHINGEDYAFHCPSDINERDKEVNEIEDILKLVRRNPYNRFRYPSLWKSYIYDGFDSSRLVNGRATMNRYIFFIQYLINDKSYIKNRIDWVLNDSSVIMDDIDCPICMDNTNHTNIAVTQCGHSFCHCCLTTTIKTSIKKDPTKRCACPMCREPLTKITCNKL